LKHLNTLGLADTAVGAAGLASVAKLSALTRLRFDATTLDDAGMAPLSKCLLRVVFSLQFAVMSACAAVRRAGTTRSR